MVQESAPLICVIKVPVLICDASSCNCCNALRVGQWHVSLSGQVQVDAASMCASQVIEGPQA